MHSCNFDLARRNADCGGTSAVGRVPIPCITIHKSHRDDRPNWMEIFGGFPGRPAGSFSVQLIILLHVPVVYLYGGKYQDHACGHVIRHADAMLARQWIGARGFGRHAGVSGTSASQAWSVQPAHGCMRWVARGGSETDRDGWTRWASCFLPFARTHAQVASTSVRSKF